MDLLKRKHAPLTDEAWKQVDDEARRVLELNLAGRRLVDFSGPHGWKLGAVNTGRLTRAVEGPVAGVPSSVRVVQPLVEMRAPFTMKIWDLDLDPVIAVAERVARAEDTAIFHGYKAGGIEGIVEASPHDPIEVTGILEWPRAIVAGIEALRAAGMNGPYALALGVQAFDELDADSEDGYPLRKRIEESVPVTSLVWAPAVRGGAVLMSTRGGDYELTVGQDLSVGYAVHDRTDVELYLTESFTFRVLEEKAAIFLRRAGAPAGRPGQPAKKRASAGARS